MPAGEGPPFSVECILNSSIWVIVEDRVTFSRQGLLPEQGQKVAVAHLSRIPRTQDFHCKAVSQQSAKAVPFDS